MSIDKTKEVSIDMKKIVSIDVLVMTSIDSLHLLCRKWCPPYWQLRECTEPYHTFSSRIRKPNKNWKNALDKITVELPLSDAMKFPPSINKYVKDMVSKRFPSAEHSIMIVSDKVSAMIQGELPIKRPEHGSFVLIYNIQDRQFNRSLCDLGSSVDALLCCHILRF